MIQRNMLLLLCIILALRPDLTSPGDSNVQLGDDVCTTYELCDDPDQLLIGVFNILENNRELHGTFDHINHRPPPYVLVTYALNATTFPLPCDSVYGSGLIPATVEGYNKKGYQLESWIWTTSPIHAVASPFTIVEFGLFTPWISYELLFPRKSFSLMSVHGGVCIALPYQLSNDHERKTYNLASVTSRVCRLLLRIALISIIHTFTHFCACTMHTCISLCWCMNGSVCCVFIILVYIHISVCACLCVCVCVCVRVCVHTCVCVHNTCVY